MVFIVNQRPLGRTCVTEPVVFHVSCGLFCADKWRPRRFARFGETLRFYQEEFAFSQSQKWLMAVGVGAVTKHGDNCLLCFNLSKCVRIQQSMHVVCQASINCAQELFGTFWTTGSTSDYLFAE